MTDVLTVVIPVYNEGDAVLPYLRSVLGAVSPPFEVLIVHDMPEDTTVPVVEALGRPEVRPVLNTYGRGPANAIRFGMDAAAGDVVVVTMADGSDDATQIDELAGLVRSGFVVAAASRYMSGGRQVGGPPIKNAMSRVAGISLYHLGRVGTRDATNSFKAYSTEFFGAVGVESDGGFEIGIELVAKARRARLPVAEIPTTWHDRTEGQSRFRVAAWTPRYLRWYLYAFAPPAPVAATRGRERSR